MHSTETRFGPATSGTPFEGAPRHVAFFSPANLNLIDGSAIWVESIASSIAAFGDVDLVVPHLFAEKRSTIIGSIRALPRVRILDPMAIRRLVRSIDESSAPVPIPGAVVAIDLLDRARPFDAIIVRSHDAALAFAQVPRLRDRLWATYVIEPERDPDDPEYQDSLVRISESCRYLVCQSDEMRRQYLRVLPGAADRIIVLPPAIPDASPTAGRGKVVHRLLYAGKFHPMYPVERMIEWRNALASSWPDIELHVVGDKFAAPAQDPGYPERLRSKLSQTDGVIWHGGRTRGETTRLLADGGIPLCVWDMDHSQDLNDAVISTKLLDYAAARLPVVVTRTTAHARVLGSDYPLLVDHLDEVPFAIERVLGDPGLWEQAADRAWQATRPFTYRHVHEEVMARLDAVPLARDMGGVGSRLPGGGWTTGSAPYRSSRASSGLADDAPPEGRIRILHAPKNIANQAGALISEFRRLGHVAEVWEYDGNAFGFPADRVIPLDGHDAEIYWSTFLEAIDKFDVFHFHFGRSLFAGQRGGALPLWDLPIYRMLGKRVFFTWHGTDCRLRSVHLENNPFSFFRTTDIASDDDRTRKVIETARTYANEMFVVSPNYLDFVPDALVVPRVVNLQEWPAQPPRQREFPVVLHVPSRRGTKGTSEIVEAVSQIASDGIRFDFRLLEGVSHAEAQRAIADADVVVDNVITGDYEVVSIEAMASSRVAVANLGGRVIELSPDAPIYSVDPPSLRSRLADLITDVALRQHLAAQGRPFVERVHDAPVIAKTLVQRYRAASTSPAVARSFPEWSSLTGSRRIEQLEAQLNRTGATITGLRREREALRTALGLSVEAPVPALTKREVLRSLAPSALLTFVRAVRSRTGR